MKANLLAFLLPVVAVAVYVTIGGLSAHSQESDTSINVFGELVDVRYQTAKPITGIDAVVLVESVVPGIETIKLINSVIPSNDGIEYSWIAENKDEYFKLRGDNGPTVWFKAGVFTSHRAAVETYARTLMQVVPKLDPIRISDPGFLLWSFPQFNSLVSEKTFVRDNVLITVGASYDFDLGVIINAIDRSLKQGTNGVERGEKVILPTIVSDDFPDVLTTTTNDPAKTTLAVLDPNNRYVYRMCLVDPRSLPSVEPGQAVLPYVMPLINWLPNDELEIRMAWGNLTVDLVAWVVNDRCVVSDECRITVTINGPAKAELRSGISTEEDSKHQ